MSVQSMGEDLRSAQMGKFFCPKVRQLFLENIYRWIKGQTSPSAVARTMPSKAASSGREEKEFRIHIQKIREYLEYGNQIGPNLSPP